MKRLGVVLILFFVLAVIIAAYILFFQFNYLRPVPKDPKRKAAIEEEIYAAVLIEELRDKDKGEDSYLSIDDSDPSDELLACLAESGLVFKKYSEGPFGETTFKSIDAKANRDADTEEDTETDFNARYVTREVDIAYFHNSHTLAKLEWLSGRRVRIEYGDVWRIVADCYVRIELEKKWGRWVVVSREDVNVLPIDIWKEIR